MHMADSLISPSVGGTMLAVTAGIGAFSLKKISDKIDLKKVPLMGVLGAFIFAAQMINFSIPGTGSSGHLGGGLLLAALLGPYAGFITMAAILLIQAFFFADGGLLALGCNIFNLGFYTCFIAYPFIFKPLLSKKVTPAKILLASLLSAIAGLQLGAFSVVLETMLSGKTDIPFGIFVLLMQPVHLAIGFVEGLISFSVLSFVWKVQPELIDINSEKKELSVSPARKIIIAFIIAAILTGGILSWFASTHPDGLEWSLFKVTGKEELETKGKIYQKIKNFQEKTAFLPDYSLKSKEEKSEPLNEKPLWPQIDKGTTISGIVGSILVFFLAIITGFIIFLVKKINKRKTY